MSSSLLQSNRFGGTGKRDSFKNCFFGIGSSSLPGDKNSLQSAFSLIVINQTEPIS